MSSHMCLLTREQRAGRRHAAAEPEVADLDLKQIPRLRPVGPGDEDVLGLEVAVEEAVVVDEDQGRQHRRDDALRQLLLSMLL